MATWETATWQSSVASGVPRHARQSGEYARYLPDRLDGAALAVDGGLARQISRVEREIRRLNGPGADGLAGIARFLLRSEAIASSLIEGIAASPRQVALAELGQSESVRGISEQAQLVARNMTIVRQATSALVSAESLDVDDIVSLHSALLTDERHHGLRAVQNWIGPSAWTPLTADFVPPPAEMVPELMADLVSYMNGSGHSPLVQAAIVHAQFETIHPFTDGNGRVGRALIHTVLARGGLTNRAVLPISLVLATLQNLYVDGLTTYRHSAPTGSPEASFAINGWLRVFTQAASIAVAQSQKLIDNINELRAQWSQRLADHRTGLGMRSTPRSDSASARVLRLLPEAPVLTATTLSKILGVSLPAAGSALDEFEGAGILTTKTIQYGARAYIAGEILDLVTLSERALASTQFDTRVAAPHDGVSALPPA